MGTTADPGRADATVTRASWPAPARARRSPSQAADALPGRLSLSQGNRDLRRGTGSLNELQ